MGTKGRGQETCGRQKRVARKSAPGGQAGIFGLLVAVLLVAGVTREALGGGACTCARFHDWKDFGCHISPGAVGAPGSGADKAGGNQTVCPTCPPIEGIPRWRVDEPYISLHIADEPLSYPTSSGQPMTFRWSHKQRFQLPQPDECPNLYSIPFSRPSLDQYSANGMRTYGMTNASWGHNWMMDILFWNTNWEGLMPSQQSVTPMYGSGYEALVFRPDGGTYYFNVAGQPAAGRVLDPLSQVSLEPLSGLGYPLASNFTSIDTSVIYWGDPAVGFRLRYPDGSQDVFGVARQVNQAYAISTAHAFLTQRIDPEGRATRLGYEWLCFTNVWSSAYPQYQTHYYVYRLKYVVDPDGRTNTFIYNNNTSSTTLAPRTAWELTEVDDPYGRKATLTYGRTGLLNLYNSGLLAAITDAAGNSNSFAYKDASGWISSLTTPYGPTSFGYCETPDTTDPVVPGGFSRRGVYVTQPDGGHQLYCYLHQANVSASATAPQAPNQTFDDGNSGANHPGLNYRDTFHWDERQCEALSSYVHSYLLQGNIGNALGQLTPQDLNKATMQHWLWAAVNCASDGVSLSESVSSERDPSPDSGGLIEGNRTWYNYPNKCSPENEGDPQVSCVARQLPDGTSQYALYTYYPNYLGAPWPGLVQYNQTTYSLPDGTVGARTNWFGYAANGIDLLSVSNSAGQWVNLAYNSSHQVTFLTNTLNQVSAFIWDSTTHNLTSVSLSSGPSANLSYYGSNPLDPNGSLLQNVSLPATGRSLSFTYAAGLPQTIQAGGTGLPDLWTTNTWDGLNRLTSVAFPDGTTISNVYDRLHIGRVKDRLGYWTGYGYDALEHLTSITNALNNVTTFSWCDCGALTSTTDPLTNTTIFSYNNQGLLTNLVFADGSSLNYSYDSVSRLTEVADGLGRAMAAGYNNQGLLTSVSNAYGPLEQVLYDAADRPIQITDANGVTVTDQYDLLNRLTSRTWLADGIGEGFGWATNGLVACTNRNQMVTRYARDAAGRITAVTNANLEVTQFGYNSLGEITDLWDGRTNHTTWTYNEYGLLTNKTDALGRSALGYAYNANGWLTNRWTPEFGNTGYIYDPVGNLKTINYPLSTLNYLYDALNRLTNMVDASGTNVFTYTQTGQLEGETGPWPNAAVAYAYTQGLRTSLFLNPQQSTIIYSYDNTWRLQSLASSTAGTFQYNYQPSTLVSQLLLPNFASITNHYDSLARLDYTALVNRWGHVLDGYSYVHDPLGLRTNILRDLGGTSSASSLKYDSIGQITSWTATESDGTPRLNEQLGFGFDKAGNLLSRTNGNLIQTFANDSLNQLTNVSRTGTFTVSGATPGPAANVTVNGITAQRYGDFTFAATNQTLTNGSNTFTIIAQKPGSGSVTNTLGVNLPASVNLQFDRNGNLTNDGARSFGYSAENQLTNILVVGNWRSVFVYDGLGRRRIARDYAWSSSIGNWQLTNETRYVYDGLLPVQELDTNNDVLVTYTRGLDLSGSLAGAGGIGGLLARTDNSGSTFYHSDGAGNITALIDGNQSMAARYMYQAFGKLIGKSGLLADANAMQFSSMPVHRQSGMSMYAFRGGYDPAFQRWTQRDPIGELGGVNLYGFVGNNPINLIDPYGLSEEAGVPLLGNLFGDLLKGVEDMATLLMSSREPPPRPIGGEYPEVIQPLVQAPAVSIDLSEPPGLGRNLLLTGLGMAAPELLGASCPTAKTAETVGEGTKVFRVWGDEAGAWGRSWTTVDPRTVPNYRNISGLPSQNTGRFLSEGILQHTEGVTTRWALPLDGNAGGLPEVVIPNPAQQIKLQNVQGLNPQF